MTVLPVLSIALIAACALIAGCISVAAVRRRYIVVTVRGSSMCPTYDDADRVLVRRTQSVPMCGPLRGEVIVLRAPVRALAEISPLLVKRVAAVPGDEIPPDFRQAAPLPLVPPGQLLVRGDNDRSADSRSFGLIDFGLIVGTVVRGKQLNHSGRRLPLRKLMAEPNVELQLRATVLYNSIYRADDQVLVNTHIYGIMADNAPVLHLRKIPDGEMTSTYLDSSR